ncbi:MAG: hypothetical protein AB7U85_03865 [Alphaproteobacteria bacterium]
MLKVLILFSFLTAVSCSWLISAGYYLYYSIGIDNFLSLNPSDLALYICAIMAPIAVIWLITGFTHHIFSVRYQNNLSTTLLYQARRSSEHTEALVKSMLEIQDQTKSGVLLHNIPIAINNLNEIMAQIALRFGFLTSDATESLWIKVKNGNLWAFCRVIIDNAARTRNFESLLLKQTLKDETLASAIIEFCKRFKRLKGILSKHDKESFLSEIIEDGSLGKVYALISPVLKTISPKSADIDTNDDKSKETESQASETASNEEKYAFFKSNFTKHDTLNNDEHTDSSLFSVKANIRTIDDFSDDNNDEVETKVETEDKNHNDDVDDSNDIANSSENDPEKDLPQGMQMSSNTPYNISPAFSSSPFDYEKEKNTEISRYSDESDNVAKDYKKEQAYETNYDLPKREIFLETEENEVTNQEEEQENEKEAAFKTDFSYWGLDTSEYSSEKQTSKLPKDGF